jgi:hypothetical protein
MDIKEITPGKSYACKFKVMTMLDAMGRPAPNLSDVPLKGPGIYEGLGVLMERDLNTEMVKLRDEKSSKEFTVPFGDIWDVDEVEWVSPLENQ